VLHLPFYSTPYGHKVSNHTVENSKIGCVYVVFWICIVDSHPVIKKSLAVGIIPPIYVTIAYLVKLLSL